MSANVLKHDGLQKTVLAEAQDAIDASTFNERRITRGAVNGRLNPALIFGLLVCILVVIAMIAVGRGAFPIHAGEVMSILMAQMGVDIGIPYSSQQEAVLLSIRLPRVLLGVVGYAREPEPRERLDVAHETSIG